MTAGLNSVPIFETLTAFFLNRLSGTYLVFANFKNVLSATKLKEKR